MANQNNTHQHHNSQETPPAFNNPGPHTRPYTPVHAQNPTIPIETPILLEKRAMGQVSGIEGEIVPASHTESRLDSLHCDRTTLTRRAALQALGCLALLYPGLAGVESGQEIPAYPAIADTERNRLIGQWYKKLDQAIVSLERLWGAIGETRLSDPAAVDGLGLLALLFEAQGHIEAIHGDIVNGPFDEILELATGQNPYVLYLAYEIVNGSSDPEHLRREIESMGQDRPEDARLLQQLLEQRGA